jgi:uncharacterized membrane protein
MLGAGVLLFVSAHWDTLSPSARFTLVLILVAGFHVAGALAADRHRDLATALHAVGTVTLGAGIYLSGQIFNLDEHWPGGLMLWALGAALGWALLRDWPQIALTAVLAPAWLSAEWFVATQERFLRIDERVPAVGVFLLALAYFTAVREDETDTRGRVFLWLGRIALLPSAIALAFASSSTRLPAEVSTEVIAIGWSVALGLPLTFAIATRRFGVWPIAVAAMWAFALVLLGPQVNELARYAWWALGAIALAGWGVRDGRGDLINFGVAVFAGTVLTFYFSSVMDKLGRSASLVGFGLLFLAGGWGLERVRRGLVAQIQRSQS